MAWANKAAWANGALRNKHRQKRLLKNFGMGNISIDNETVDNWKIAWKILRMKLQQGLQRNKIERLSQKNMQSEISRNHTKTTMDG